ncbi:MAG: MFS transporter [Chthonomonas sp.]|nr:MFS transporter [Chthonomonas sp.]
MRKNALFGIFLTVFLDMLGFGMFIPDLQIRGKQLAAQVLGVNPLSDSVQLGMLVGFSLAIFSLAQLIISPIMGRLSDARGRKIVLLWSAIFTLIGYLIYANATSFSLIMVSRLMTGIGAANLGVAFAYVADVTTPENRGKGLGMIGAAFGLGFVLGPPLGVLLLHLGKDSPALLGYVGAALILVNVLFIQFGLAESPRENLGKDAPSLWQNFRLAWTYPQLRLLLIMSFVLSLGFTNLETTYFQLLESPRSNYQLTAEQAKVAGGWVLTFVGVVAAIMQGGLVGPAIKRFGEINLVKWGFLITAIGLLLVPHGTLWAPTLIVVALIGIGNGLANPSLSALTSHNAPITMQGGIFGISMALGALARTVGPIVSNPLFQKNPAYPYLLGGGLILIPAFAAWGLRPVPPAESAT